MAFFPSWKQNFIAYLSSKVSSRPDCIFEIHQVWQSGFSRVYSNCYCSCWFQPEIIKTGQSSHKMYSNNILNFQASQTILNTCTKKSGNYWRHHVFWSGSYAEFVNIEVILNSRRETLCDAVYFYIYNVTDKIPPWRTPSSCLWRLEVRKKTLYELGQSALPSHAMQVFYYSEPPGGVVSLLQMKKKDCYKVLFLDVGLSYGGFQFNHMINCRSPLSESTFENWW